MLPPLIAAISGQSQFDYDANLTKLGTEEFMNENEASISKPKSGTSQDLQFATSKVRSMEKHEILALYDRYLGGEKIQDLIDELSLNIRAPHFFNLFKGVVINDLCCPYCAHQMTAELESKSNYFPLQNQLVLHTCSNEACGHYLLATITGVITDSRNQTRLKKCTCANCKAASREAANSYAERIRNTFAYPTCFDYDDLHSAKLDDLVTLLALLRAHSTEDFGYIKPFTLDPIQLTPNENNSLEVLRRLYRHHFISVDVDNSPLSAFVDEENEIKFYMLDVALQPAIAVLDVQDIPKTIEILKHQLSNPSESQAAELSELMLYIAREECVQFMRYILAESGFEHYVDEVSDKTMLQFDELLQKLPVSQILPCIWSAIKGAAAFIQHPTCTGRKHAFNTIQGKIRKEAMKRLAGNAAPKPFDRNTYCPRSEISYTLYEILGYENDVGFYSRLDDIQVPDSWMIFLQADGRSAQEKQIEKLLAAMKKIAECDSIFEAQDIAREASAEAGRIL